MRIRTVALAATLQAALSLAFPLAAEVDLAGEWSIRVHEDQPERGPGPEIGDFAGLPINAAARQRGMGWDASLHATVVGGVDVGAAIVAHEATLLRVADAGDVPVAAQPTETFYVPKIDFFFNGEPVEVLYKPGVDDTNVAVHFRRSDVIATGDLFRLDGYPRIDLAKGGSIRGVLEALNSFVDLAVSDTLSEGGTMLIPGHGRICDEADLVRYRDMLTIIRDRIAALKERGQTLAQIKAAKPTLDYESRYGRDPAWTGDDFIEAVYASLGT